MQLKLKQLFLLSSFFMLHFLGKAQSTNVSKSVDYYIELKGITTKTDLKNLSNVIKAKNEVSFFSSYHGTPMFHILKLNKSISKAEFVKWIEPLKLQVVKFEVKEITADFIHSKKAKKKSRDKSAQSLTIK